jgi:nitrile hydratase
VSDPGAPGHADQGHADQGHADHGHADHGHADQGHADQGHADHGEHGHASHGEHDHGHAGHDHGDHRPHRPRPASAPELRARALEALLVAKGLVTTEAVDQVIAYYEHDVGPQNGAKVVARAWVDPAYRERLLADGTSAVRELGYGGAEGDNLVVVANTPTLHNAVVCTLCSCYPWPVLGLPPAWYKSPPYRARMVAEPRAVLREFGLELPAEVEVRVWDSSAEVRYLVLPMRPAGTDRWSQERLAGIVTRDCMIGTAVPSADAAAL